MTTATQNNLISKKQAWSIIGGVMLLVGCGCLAVVGWRVWPRALPPGCPPACAGVDLRWSNLRDHNFRQADLRGAQLSFANLRGADLSGADLQGAT